MTALIDGDSISYIIGWNHRDTPRTNPNSVVANIDTFMEKLFTGVKASNYIGFVADHRPTFRHLSTVQGLFSGDQSEKLYKGSRGAQKPDFNQQWGGVINGHLVHNYGFQIISSMESEDGVGICARKFIKEKKLFTICGVDKDLHQIPGLHYNYRTWESRAITEDEADYILWKQILTGDSIDDVPGIPGIGPAKADKILAKGKPGYYKYLVLEAYSKKYGDREGALKFAEMCNLIMLLDKPIYNFEVPSPVVVNGVKNVFG